jgi:hypothetical protein
VAHTCALGTGFTLVAIIRASLAVVLSMFTLQKDFHIQVLLIYFFTTPPIKLKLGLQIGWGVLIANHLDESLRWAQWEILSNSQIIFIIPSSAGAHRCCAIYQPPQPLQLCWAKTIFVSQIRRGARSETEKVFKTVKGSLNKLTP